MIWRLEYENAHGDVARLDIQRGAATPVEIIEGTENPFLLSYELEDKSKKGFIMSSFADISIYETATFNIDDLKTLDETALSVKWYINSVLEWAGFVVPDFFSRTIGEPAIVNLAASDRLSSLEDATLDGLSEYITLRDLAETCLAKTGLSLPLINTVDFKAKSGQNTIDLMAVYALSDRLEDDKGKKISCFDVLRSILVLTNSTIRQRKGQWRIYNKIQHEAVAPTLNFDEVYQGAKRTIQPVFSSVGVFQEFGGGKRYPSNNNFQLATGWTAKNGFVFARENREVIGYTVTGDIYQPTCTPIYGGATDNYRLANNNDIIKWEPSDITGSPYLESTIGRVPYDKGLVKINIVLNAVAPNVKAFQTPVFWTGQAIWYAVIAESPTETLILTNDGAFVPIANGWKNFQKFEFIPSDDEEETAAISKGGNLTASLDVAGSEYYDISVRIYGSGSRITTFIDSISFSFSSEQDSGKGILYRTDQLGSFSKKSDPNTTIFGDFISSGLNGYFYQYSEDNTSILRSPSGSNLPLSKWTTATDPTAGELPILQHVTRQMSRMFGVAHNVLSAVIDAKTFDPLAIVTNCAGEKYVIVYSVFDFLRSTVEVELQQIAYGSLQRRDFIFSYFGGGDGDGISSIGSVSGGGSSSGGGGGIPQTLDLLADELFISGGNSVDLGVYARKTWVETEATAFNSARLGGYSAASYPRKAEAAVITQRWTFDNSSFDNHLRLKRGVYNTFISVGSIGQLVLNGGGDAVSDSVFLNNGNLGIGGLVSPTERLHVAGNGLFTGNTPRIEFHDTATSQASRWVLSGGSMRLQAIEYGTSAYIGQSVIFSALAPNSALVLNASGDLSVIGNITAQGSLDVTGISTFRDRIGTNAFVSGFTGDGTWRLQTGDETHLTVDRLTVRGRMDVYELVINQIRATNGSLWVTDAMKTTGATRLGSSFRFAFDNDNGNRGCTFVVGDIVKAQRFTGRGVVVFVGYVDVVSADSFVIYTSGYMPNYTGDLETLAGLEFVRIGNAGDVNRQGSLYLTSSDSGAPYLDVLDGVNSASLAGRTKVRLGKLDGISDSELGSLTGYGLYAENAYLKGKIIAKSGVIGGWDITTDRIRKLTAAGGLFYIMATDQPRIEMQSDGTIDNRIMMFYNNSNQWGLLGDAGGKRVFWLGSTNQIAGINFNDSRLFTSKWWIDKDGSFSLGDGKITGTAEGNVTIEGSLVTQHITAQSIEGLDLNFTKGKIGGFDINADSIGKEGSSSDLFLSNNRFYLRESGSVEFDVRNSEPYVVDIRDQSYRTLAKVGMRIRISGSTTLNRALETYGEVLFMSDNGVYGIRINDDGIKKTTNSGTSWHNI